MSNGEIILTVNIIERTGWFWIGTALFGVVLVAMACCKTCDELKLKRNTAVLFPFGALIMAGIMANSMFQTLVRKKTQWRGRVYPID